MIFTLIIKIMSIFLIVYHKFSETFVWVLPTRVEEVIAQGFSYLMYFNPYLPIKAILDCTMIVITFLTTYFTVKFFLILVLGKNRIHI